MEIKKNISHAELCEDLPDGFIEFFDDIKQLAFDEIPNYEFLKSLFRNIVLNSQITSFDVDWMVKISKYREKTLNFKNYPTEAMVKYDYLVDNESGAIQYK